MNWNSWKEEQRLILYLLGFNDGEIGALSEPVVGKSNVCSWRGRRKLLPNNGLGDVKWYHTNNPLDKASRNSPGLALSAEREELIFGFYNEGLNDVEIGKKVGRTKTSVRGWRLRKGLRANATQGRKPNKERGYQIKRKAKETEIAEKDVKKSEKKKPARTRKMSVKQQREEAEREEERAVVELLPTKDEVYRKVRNSPEGQITTKQLIREEYGDVGQSRSRTRGRGDTISKLRALVDKDKKLTLDTSGKEIIWRA